MSLGYDFKVFRDKLDEAYWLLTKDESELKEAEKEYNFNPNEAREIVFEVISNFFEKHQGKVFSIDETGEDLKYSISKLEEMLQDLNFDKAEITLSKN